MLVCTNTDMGTKTIGLDDEAYERLRAQKRDGESFSDTVKRITEAVASDWREGFGRLDDETADRVAAAVARTMDATVVTNNRDDFGRFDVAVEGY